MSELDWKSHLVQYPAEPCWESKEQVEVFLSNFLNQLRLHSRNGTIKNHIDAGFKYNG